jgi:PAS domain S-box-containing protein
MTQLKKAEQALQESEKKHRTLVEQSLQGMVVIQDFRICFANTAIAQIYGYTIEELFSLSPEELRALIHPQDQALVWGRFSDRLAGKRVPAEYECRITRKDGALRWVEIFSSLIQYRGKPAVQAALIDITERKHAEERLEWELAVNSALAELSAALITPSSSIEDIADIVLDAAKSLTQSEHGYVSSIDLKTGDQVAHTLTKMMGKQCLVRGKERRIRFPKGPDGLYPWLWGHALNTRQAFFSNSPGTHKASRGAPQGHVPINNYLAVPAIIGEELVGQIAVANSSRDYTDRELEAIKRLAGLYAVAIERKRVEEALRESEEKFRNLAEQSPNMIFINKKGRVVYANKKCEEFMGYKREEFYSPDFDFLALIAPESKDLIKLRFSKHTEGEEVTPYEYVLVTKEGRKIEAILSTKLIKYEGESAILGTVTDIAERKRAEEQIQKLNKSLELQAKELQLANKELEAFSYSVSHDLRAPLRAIDGFSKALLEDYHEKLEEQGRDYLTRVRTSTRHMTQLIDDLLNLSLVMRAKIRRKKTNLSKLARTISKELQKAEPQREVEFVIPEGVYAHGDPRLLRRVLENLLGNAWKFTANHPRATIEFGATKKGSDTVYFVRDDGAGFDITYANRLFIPFQRLHSTAEFSGSGIGLAIASRIINRHGGRIWAEGQVEKGATFYFTLKQEKEVDVP